MSAPTSTSRLLKRKQDFSKLMHIPNALQKVLRMTSKAIHSDSVPEPKSITSSTKRMCVRTSKGEILMPLMRPWDLASTIKRLSPSMTSMKSKGERGQPCLMPREALKNFEGVPLTRTTKIVEEIKAIIQLTPRRGMPIWIRMSLMYDQLTLSNAFTKSNFKMRAHIFLVFTVCRVSWIMPMGSTICLSFRKPYCSLEICVSKWGFNWTKLPLKSIYKVNYTRR